MQRLLSRKLLAFSPKERFNFVVSSYANFFIGKKSKHLLVDYIVRQTMAGRPEGTVVETLGSLGNYDDDAEHNVH